ncbi:MAG: aminomethyl-transferring glycine dehydrogenase subunit GcvPA [Myxococcales bacterium]|nr:aminomethyl-transferring glycine dehydrogenase subunit GcvPA [Myxococcales bacterium]MDH3485746.1 aminomethyl-transferring glycine dehydrogenase subunit GcvPA [Myxococcales bacterium]
MRYLPHTDQEIRAMLERVGVEDIDALFAGVPSSHLLQQDLDLEPALDEPRLMQHLTALSNRNAGAHMLTFLGGGMYRHHIPPAVDQLLQRSEFYTAYTPYQAELSQGTLQAIFEFQTVVCELFGVDVANASMYDGASSVAEAVLMARRIKRRDHIVVSGGLHPEYLDTVRSYIQGIDARDWIAVAPLGADGRTDWEAATSLITDKTAAVVVGYPNFFGCVEDLHLAKDAAESHGALLITATTEPYALSVVEAPGTCGADICVGEGQALAVPPQYGGPGVGLFGASQAFVRQMPGRLVGRTIDTDGQPGYVLTLSTREQHIRREKATSNICTNHGLIALAMGIRTAMLGKQGFIQAGERCMSAAHYLRKGLERLDGIELPYSAPVFNELVARFKNATASEVVARLAERDILAGVDLGRFRDDWKHDLLIAVTELHTRDDLDRLLGDLSP